MKTVISSVNYYTIQLILLLIIITFTEKHRSGVEPSLFHSLDRIPAVGVLGWELTGYGFGIFIEPFVSFLSRVLSFVIVINIL